MADAAGFINFLRTFAGIPPEALPDHTAFIYEAFDAAVAVVNQQIFGANTFQYDWAVYNYGTDAIINWATDQEGQTFFADARKQYGINNFVAGFVNSASDEGTSASLQVPDSLMKFTLGDLSLMKTPYGRAYLEQAQKVGTCWGLS